MSKVHDFAVSQGVTNVFLYAACEERCFERQASECGYQRITTFYSDLSIAEWVSDIAGVQDTYNRVVNEWLSDYKYFTEFVLALNWKAWAWCLQGGRGYVELSDLYSKLYEQARDKFYEHYKDNDEAKDYFFQVTD